MFPLCCLWHSGIMKDVKIMEYLVRYGQTDWNLLKMFNGIMETESNETGLG